MNVRRNEPTGTAARVLCVRVLVVDDNAINRELATALLECWGVRAVEASNGAEAVRLVDDGREFDLVLMDIRMPVMDGLAATARIRQLEIERVRARGLRLTIVALTSEDLPAGEAHLQQLGLDALLSKPLTAITLMACLERWCPNTFRPN
jgi:CheY-like chemotaxis protein